MQLSSDGNYRWKYLGARNDFDLPATCYANTGQLDSHFDEYRGDGDGASLPFDCN